MKLQLDKVIGHRGACGYAPENTMSSMTKAYELGAKWVEFDVMLARCNEAIIMHDTTLDRTTNGKGNVAEHDYAMIATLDSGSWYGKEYQDQKVPTFRDMLKHLAALKMGINVEVKPCPGFEIKTAEEVLRILKANWPNQCPAPLVSSFYPEVIRKIRSLDPLIYIGFVIDNWHQDWQSIITQNQCVSLHVDHKILTRQKVEEIKSSVKYVLSYTVNSPERAKILFEWGVDSIFTDYPDRILKALS